MNEGRKGSSPHVVLIGGPNGAGKTTAASSILQGELRVTEFVNADTIAQGLSAFSPEAAAIHAGRVMTQRIRDLVRRRRDFAFETTLASKSFAPLVDGWMRGGYRFHLVFLWLPAPRLALARVEERVRGGGHMVPAETIERRFHRGLRNFFDLYRPRANTWRFYDNSGTHPRIVAQGRNSESVEIRDAELWRRIEESGYGT